MVVRRGDHEVNVIWLERGGDSHVHRNGYQEQETGVRASLNIHIVK